MSGAKAQAGEGIRIFFRLLRHFSSSLLPGDFIHQTSLVYVLHNPDAPGHFRNRQDETIRGESKGHA